MITGSTVQCINFWVSNNLSFVFFRFQKYFFSKTFENWNINFQSLDRFKLSVQWTDTDKRRGTKFQLEIKFSKIGGTIAGQVRMDETFFSIFLGFDFSFGDEFGSHSLQNSLRFAVGEIVDVVIRGRDFYQPVNLRKSFSSWNLFRGFKFLSIFILIER